MAVINWDSVMRKAEAHMESPSMKRERSEAVDEIAMSDLQGVRRNTHTVEEAAAKFAGVLYLSIRSAGLHPNVEERLANLEYGNPHKVGDKQYEIYVWFEEDLTRESMSTKKEYYPVDLAELYNDGVDHVMKQIFEHIDNILLTSTTVILDTHFMEQAIIDFMGNYASDYHVTDIQIRREHT